MSSRVQTVTKSVLFCAVLALLLALAETTLTPAPGTVAPWAAVADTRNQADVLVLGSSRAYCTVLPMEMWRSGGVTALDITSGSLSLPATVEYLGQTLAEQNPQVVLLEVHMVGRRRSFEVAAAHGALDYMPRGIARTRAIIGSVLPSEWFEHFFPLQTYHSRWNGLGQFDYLSDKREKYAFARGAAYLPETKDVTGYAADSRVREDAYQQDLLEVRRIARRVESEGAKFILFTAPSMERDTVAGRELMDRLESDLSPEFPSITYLDMNSASHEAGIDPAADFKDEQHLNHRGAVKMTAWLLNLLDDRYDLPDHRNDGLSAEWNASLAKYDEMFIADW